MKLVKNLKSLDEYITAKGDNKVYYQGKLCYFKTGETNMLLNELVAEYLAKDFNIASAHYEIGLIGNTPVVISQSVFAKDSNYYSLFDLIKYDIDLETLWNELELKYKDYTIVERLMEEIVKVFLFDILIANDDRHGLNLYIIENSDGPHVAPIFDNESMLSELSINYQMYILNIEPVNNRNNTNILNRFLSVSSSRYAKILEDNLWIISEENIKKVLSKIEEDRKIILNEKYKKDIIEGFKLNAEMIKKALNKEKRIK